MTSRPAQGRSPTRGPDPDGAQAEKCGGTGNCTGRLLSVIHILPVQYATAFCFSRTESGHTEGHRK